MTTLHYTKGLPASGKSTHARNMVKEALNAKLLVRVNRDDIRAMMGITTGQHEPLVTKCKMPSLRQRFRQATTP